MPHQNDRIRSEHALAAILAADVVGYSRLIEADEADRLSPRDPASGLWTIARSWVAFIQGDVAKAAEWAKWITETNPEFPAGWRHLAAFCGLPDRKEEADFAAGELRRRMPNVTVSNSRDQIFARTGRFWMGALGSTQPPMQGYRNWTMQDET